MQVYTEEMALLLMLFKNFFNLFVVKSTNKIQLFNFEWKTRAQFAPIKIFRVWKADKIQMESRCTELSGCKKERRDKVSLWQIIGGNVLTLVSR